MTMAEFLVRFDIAFPPGFDARRMEHLYTEEATAARPLIQEGLMRMVWRIPGTRNHWAYWNVPDADFLHRAYSSFPLWKAGFGVVAEVVPLADNPNNPGWPVSVSEGTMPLTWENLYPLAVRQRSSWPHGTTIAPNVSLHVHPESPFPREVHFMVDGQKVAAIGPPDKQEGEALAGGYVALIARWEHQPVMHYYWWNKIMQDNRLNPTQGPLAQSYEHARDAHDLRDWQL
jgi:muconolactone D-isomerase